MKEYVGRVFAVIKHLEGRSKFPTKTKIMQTTGWLKDKTQDILDYMVEEGLLTKERMKRGHRPAYFYRRTEVK